MKNYMLIHIGLAMHANLSSLPAKLGSHDLVTDFGLVRFACAFTVYHTLAKQHPNTVADAASSGNFSASLEIALKSAKASCSEWG